jgi:hypothetical protein
MLSPDYEINGKRSVVSMLLGIKRSNPKNSAAEEWGDKTQPGPARAQLLRTNLPANPKRCCSQGFDPLRTRA